MTRFISNPLASELLLSLLSSSASDAPSRFNHSDGTGFGIIIYYRASQKISRRTAVSTRNS